MTIAVPVTAAVAIGTLVSLRRNHNAERAGTVAGFTILTLLLLSNVTRLPLGEATALRA